MNNSKQIEKNNTLNLEEIIKKAEQNDADAQITLARMYLYGIDNIEQDTEKAIEWFSRAADFGNAQAQYELREFYLQKYEDARNDGEYDCEDEVQKAVKWLTEAVDWYTKAAKQGFAPAQISLGNMYSNGKGVDFDLTTALEWYGKAEKLKYTVAQFNEEYPTPEQQEDDDCTYQDFGWALKAAQRGKMNAQYQVGYMYEFGNGVETDLRKALEWYSKAAELGHTEANDRISVLNRIFKLTEVAEFGIADAQFDLGFIYEKNSEIKADIAVTAVEWYIKAANQGHAQAQFRLGRMYENGIGVKQDLTKAIDLYRSSAKHDNGEAAFALGRAYETGIGLEQDFLQAIEWYTKAVNFGNENAKPKLTELTPLKVKFELAEQGDTELQIELANMYLNKIYGRIYPGKAVEWYTKAAELGNSLAQASLGDLLIFGWNDSFEGFECNREKGFEWLCIACESGFSYNKIISRLYNGNGTKDLAISLTQKALEKDPENLELWNMLMHIYRALGNKEMADECEERYRTICKNKAGI